MDAMTKKFSRVLRRLRTERNLTQEALAQRAGVDYKYLQKLEGRNPSSPTLSTLEKLARGLNIQLVELIRSVQEDIPNAETVAAMEEARAGNLCVHSAKELFEALNEDD